jgi:sigma-B regulation protein RsbU (phosphoserine phosphatase)
MFRKIRTKILTVMLITALIPLIALGGASAGLVVAMRQNSIETNSELGNTAATDAGRALRDQITDDLTVRATAIAESVDAKLLAVENHTRIVAAYAEKLYANPENYKSHPLEYLQPGQEATTVPHIRTAPGVTYAEILPELDVLGNVSDVLAEFLVTDINVTASYVGTESGFFITVDTMATVPNRKDYDARTRSWYKGAKTKGGLFWTEIFADSTGRGASISCAMPIYHNGKLQAVTGTGSTMEKISEIVKGASIGKSGYAFLLDRHGEVVITPHSDFLTDESGNVIGENYLENSNPDVVELAKDMTSGKNNVRELILEGSEVIVAYAPLARTGWSIGVVMPSSEVTEPIAHMQSSIQGLSTKSENAINSFMAISFGVIAVAVVLAVVMAMIMSLRFAGTISKPISMLTEEAEEIGKGDLERTITLRTGDELEELAIAFNQMTGELRLHIKDFEQVTAETERIATELNVAKTIQAEILPHIISPSPDRNEFVLFGSMEPAKEVGGDFYDFFLIDEKTLAVVMADVSGNGVPAALFMVIAKTLIKNNAQMAKDPVKIFEEVNNILCENNEGGMFIAAFMGYLNVETGAFTFVNAGHKPPCIKHVDGGWEFLTCDPCFVLAGLENTAYKSQSLDIKEGDKIYLYTDGVTEATDRSLELYGKDRLIKTLDEHQDDSVTGIVNAVRADIKDFAHGAEQADDITMLAIEYFGAKGKKIAKAAKINTNANTDVKKSADEKADESAEESADANENKTAKENAEANENKTADANENKTAKESAEEIANAKENAEEIESADEKASDNATENENTSEKADENTSEKVDENTSENTETKEEPKAE